MAVFPLQRHSCQILVDIGSYYAFLPVRKVWKIKSAYVLQRSEVCHFEPILSQSCELWKGQFLSVLSARVASKLFSWTSFSRTPKIVFLCKTSSSGHRGCFRLRERYFRLKGNKSVVQIIASHFLFWLRICSKVFASAILYANIICGLR